MMEGQSGANMCKCSHHKFLAILVILFGLLFLGGSLGWWSSGVVNTGWPILVVLGGVFKFMKNKCTCCQMR